MFTAMSALFVVFAHETTSVHIQEHSNYCIPVSLMYMYIYTETPACSKMWYLHYK